MNTMKNEISATSAPLDAEAEPRRAIPCNRNRSFCPGLLPLKSINTYFFEYQRWTTCLYLDYHIQ
jgi:hypothetical protein